MRPRYSSFRIDSTDRGMVLLLDDDFESSAPAARVGERSWVSNSEENLLAKCSYSERKKLCKRNFSNQKNKLSSRIDFVCIDFWWEEKICQQKTVFILIACAVGYRDDERGLVSESRWRNRFVERKIRNVLVCGGRRSRHMMEDVLIATSIRWIEERGGILSWKVHH